MVRGAWALRAGVVAAALVCVARCSTGGGGGGGGGVGTSNDALIQVTPAGGTPAVIEHDSSRTEISVTPPVDRLFTASFVSQDPALQLDVRINGRVVNEGEELHFPITGARTSNDVKITVVYAGDTYSTAPSNSDGTLEVNILRVTQDAVDFRGTFNGLTLVKEGGSQTLSAEGFLEVHYGDTSLALDAGF